MEQKTPQEPTVGVDSSAQAKATLHFDSIPELEENSQAEHEPELPELEIIECLHALENSLTKFHSKVLRYVAQISSRRRNKHGN